MPKSMTAKMANFAVSTKAAALPQSARDITAASLLDWLAVGRAGIPEPVSVIVREMVLGEGGAAQSSVFGSDTRLPMRAAAMTNGTTSHALDYDDTHFLHIGHPSVVIFPAALAVGEMQQANGAEFLAAALVGIEASCRIGDWLGRAHYQAGFHQTATAGAFGATLAAARLMRLDVAQTCHALGIASTRASGLKSQFGTMGKPFNAGIAAANGVEAAMLAAAGLISNPDALEGPQGFSDTHQGENRPLDAVLEGLGTSYVLEQISHKFHACCHGTHAALEALLVLRSGLDPANIAAVEITTHPRWLKVCDQQTPSTGLQAKFSYRLTAAMVLSGIDTAALSSFTDSLCARPDLVELRDKVVAVPDPALRDTQARVHITLRDGQTLRQVHDLETRQPFGVLQKRLQAKATALVGAEAARLARKMVEALPEASGLGGVAALLRS